MVKKNVVFNFEMLLLVEHHKHDFKLQIHTRYLPYFASKRSIEKISFRYRLMLLLSYVQQIKDKKSLKHLNLIQLMHKSLHIVIITRLFRLT